MNITFRFNDQENAALFVAAVLRSEEGSVLTVTTGRRNQGGYYVTLVTENLDGTIQPPGCEKLPTI